MNGTKRQKKKNFKGLFRKHMYQLSQTDVVVFFSKQLAKLFHIFVKITYKLFQKRIGIFLYNLS